jgi:hypothetical protein
MIPIRIFDWICMFGARYPESVNTLRKTLKLTL